MGVFFSGFSNKIFGGNIKERTYLRYYRREYGDNVGLNGVSSSNIVVFVNTFFNITTTVSSVKEAIDKSYLTMIGVEVPGQEYGHNVLVIGYNPDGSFIIMNPATGKQETISQDNNVYYGIVITGNK